MAKKRVRTEHPFKRYDLDFEGKAAYMFPNDWSEDEKTKFAMLPVKIKREFCTDGGGFLHYQDEELRIKWIPLDILTKAPKKEKSKS